MTETTERFTVAIEPVERRDRTTKTTGRLWWKKHEEVTTSVVKWRVQITDNSILPDEESRRRDWHRHHGDPTYRQPWLTVLLCDSRDEAKDVIEEHLLAIPAREDEARRRRAIRSALNGIGSVASRGISDDVIR